MAVRSLPDEVATSPKLIDELLTAAGFEKLSFKGQVGQFMREHPSGSYYIWYYDDYTETSSHAIALVDGCAWNLTFESFRKEIIAVFKKG